MICLLVFALTLSSALSQSEVPLNKLFLIGGRNLAAEFTAEFVDLASPTSSSSCPPIPDYFGPPESPAVGTYIDGEALVCGGGYHPYLVSERDCYRYNPSSSVWQLNNPPMVVKRGWAASVSLSANEYWITGGYNTDVGTSTPTTEVYTVGEGFRPYVNLPQQSLYHSLVRVDPTHFMMVGNYPSTSKAYMFDIKTEVWTSLPELQTEREATHVGLVKYPDGSEVVIVAGGKEAEGSTEIFDLSTQTWRSGPPLPFEIYGGATVPYGDTFLIIGGVSSDSRYLDTIYMFDVLTESWVELPQRLGQSRAFLTAFFVPEDFVQCQ